MQIRERRSEPDVVKHMEISAGGAPLGILFGALVSRISVSRFEQVA